MAFELAKIELKAPSVGTGIKAGLKKMRSASAKLSLTFTPVAITELGWSAGDKIVVQIGSGEHHGIIRLQKNNSKGQAELAAKEAGKGGVYYSLPLGHQSLFVDRGETGRWCQWEKLESGEIEVVLPRWADETARKAVQRADPPQTRPAAQPTPAPARSVTSSLMCDPPPGRSALSQK